MAVNLCRTRAMLQIPRVVPALIARTQATQATQTTPTAGKGIPPPGNFNSATPPPPIGGNKTSPPFGDSSANKSFTSTPAGQIGLAAVLAIGAYAGYKMLSGNKEESKDPKEKKDKKDQKGQQDNEQNKAGGGSGGDQQGSKGKGNDAKK